MEKAVAFPCSYKTVRTDHPYVKKLQDTAVILYVSRKGERWWMSILELENVEKIYGENDNQVRALRNINLKVEEGEFVAIVGTSGSGKSTCLNLIGGLDNPTNGKIFIKNKEIASLSRKKRIFPKLVDFAP